MKKLLMLLAVFFAVSCGDDNDSKIIAPEDNVLKGTIVTDSGLSVDSAVLVLYREGDVSLAKQQLRIATIAVVPYIFVDSSISNNGEFEFAVNDSGTYVIHTYYRDQVVGVQKKFEYDDNLNIDIIVSDNSIRELDDESIINK